MVCLAVEKMLLKRFVSGEGQILIMKNGIALIALILFIVLQPLLFGETKERSSLDQLLALFENSDIRIEEWRLHTRGQLKSYNYEDEFVQEVEQLIEKLNSFDWKMSKDFQDEGLYMTGTYTHPNLPLEETLSIYSYPSRQHSYLMYVSYEMVAKPENNYLYDWITAERTWNKTVEAIFHKQPIVYTQVTGKDASKTDLYERALNFVEQLGAKRVEQLKETNFVSVTAYNDEWRNKLVSRGEDFNLQIGIRQEPILGLDTTVTIGTPIITTEY